MRMLILGGGALLLVILVMVGVFFFGSGHPNPTGTVHTQMPGLTTTGFTTDEKVVPAPTVTPRQYNNPAPVYVSHPKAEVPGATGEEEAPPVRIYTGQGNSSKQPEEAPPEEPSEYAPYGRLIRCKLVNTVDSATLETPIIGLIENDLFWNGKVLIHRDSEVHGIAQIDKTRERIASEGAWTIVLLDPDDPGLGRELVVKGIALDREDDPQFVTYGITDGSAGLRGMVIKTDKLAEVKLFVATLISGAAQGVSATSQSIFGTYNNPAGQSVTGLSGYAINPIAGATTAALDRYAQMIEDAIERDGYFVRVPAGKQFYLYVQQAIDLAKATVGGDRARRRVEEDYLADRDLIEKLSQPRVQRQQQGQGPGRIGGFYDNQLNQLTQSLERTGAALDAETQTLRQQIPAPSPGVSPVSNNQ
jgi:hypothetical protein